MYNKSDVAIVIPLYKNGFNYLEQISFDRLMKVLKEYDIFGIAPEFVREVPENLQIVRFADYNFISKDTYNQLMMSKEFYETFIEYEFVLIYQLDAYVFRDTLLDFANMGYDYIGAPWLYGQSAYYGMGRKVVYVGNGGLSLRRVKACVSAIERKWDLYHKLYLYKLQEDMFFSYAEDQMFKVAPIEIALRFSFETQVRKCFDLNEKNLPFGCHAWERYDIDFWRPIIEQDGYLIDDAWIKTGNEDEINMNNYAVQQKISKYLNDLKLWDNIKSALWDYRSQTIRLWGAGRYGQIIKIFLDDINIRVDSFVDIDEKKQGNMICGIPIISPSEIEENDIIFVSVSDENSENVLHSIEVMKLPNVCLCLRDVM